MLRSWRLELEIGILIERGSKKSSFGARCLGAKSDYDWKGFENVMLRSSRSDVKSCIPTERCMKKSHASELEA